MRHLLVALVLSSAACTRGEIVTTAGVASGTLPACRSAIDVQGNAVATPIEWHGATDPDDRAWLHARCLAAGSPVIVTTPSTDVVPDGAPEALTFVSWNTHVGAGDLRGFVAALRSRALTGGEPVGHFVIVMQEVIRQGPSIPATVPVGAVAARRIAASPRNGPRQEVVAAAGDAGLALYYVPGTRNGADHVEDRGNAILSTLPLADFVAVELPFERLRRVAIAARIAAGPHAGLRVATAHLDVVGGPSRIWILGSSDLRQRQAHALVSALDDGRPIAVGGDFNTWADATREPAIATLRAAWPDAALRPRQSTFFFHSLRLDYFFFRLGDGWRGGDWHVAGSAYGSDHRPLVSRLTRR